jgi:type I restriction enzyme S subunit
VGSSDSSVSIGNAQVLELTVPVPSLAEQRRLVGDVEKMKALAERFEMEIEQEAQKFKELRRALLHAAFSGNLGSK